MEQEAERWREAAAEWLAKWWQKEIDRTIASRSDAVQELAAAGGLGDLKRNAERLIASADQVAAESFGKDELWAHRQDPGPDEERTYRIYGNRDPRHLDEPTRQALGHVRALFEGTPLADRDDRTYTRHGAGFRYGIAYHWSTAMRKRINQYADSVDELARLRSEIATVRNAKSKAQARGLWDSA